MPERQQTQYTALIGDVVASRDVADRAGLQRRLRTAVDEINEEMSRQGSFVVPMAITSGDEVQGLLSYPPAAIDIVVHLADAIAPTWMTFGLGFGPIATDLAETSAEIDGPCFHRARAALERTGSKEGRWLAAEGFGEDVDRGLEGVFALMAVIRGNWTVRQAEMVRFARREEVQKEIAKTLGVSPSVVSESLRSAGYRALLAGERTARWFLSSVTES